LLEDNIKGEKILVGNTMIDTLVYADKNGLFKNNIMNDKLVSTIKDKYVVVTIHRPSNVDSQLKLEKVIRILNKLSKNYKIIFPMHHRTKARYISLIEFSEANNNPLKLNDDIIITDALGYIEFITLVKNSSLVITDSGGIQEETAFLGIPCVTLRDNTERPSTIDVGANVLSTIDALEEKANKMFDKKLDTQIELWDGKAAERIVKKLSYINS
jgi:UDP-N-acetylglucosamine 2-epimerase (non-hydrolysing)